MPKNNLFIKIYLSFWITTIFMIASMVYMDRLTESGPRIEGWRLTAGRSISFYAQEAVSIFKKEGVQGLEEFFGRLRSTTDINAFIFDSQGREVTGRTASAAVLNLVASSRNSSKLEVVFSPESDLVAQEVPDKGDESYLFAAEIPKPPHGPRPGHPPGGPPGPFPGHPLHFFVRLFIQLLISGLVCYFLALYLTAPILKLGNAARRLAAGNLSIRVSPSMGKRKDEIAGLANDFDHMAEKIGSLITSQRNLLRDISHELRSPLARLNVALGLCRQRFGPDAEKPFDRIEREVERLNELIGQILTLNKVESGSLEFAKTKVDLAKLMEDITEDADYEAGSRGRTVVLTAEPCFLEGNGDILRRAVENIVRNAVHYTPEGSSVEVTLRCLRDPDKDQASITVRDHGKGVAEDALPKLFTPFYRVEDGEDRATGGTGLGLAIAEAAVRFHGGTVRAANAPDGGLIVEIILPLCAGS